MLLLRVTMFRWRLEFHDVDRRKAMGLHVTDSLVNHANVCARIARSEDDGEVLHGISS